MVNKKSSKNMVIKGKRRTMEKTDKARKSKKSKKQYKNSNDTSEEMRQILDSPIDVNKYLGGINQYNINIPKQHNQMQQLSETLNSPLMMNNPMMGNPMMNNPMMGNPIMGNPMMNNQMMMSPVSPSNVDPLLLEASVPPMNQNLMANFNLPTIPNYSNIQFRGMNGSNSQNATENMPQQQMMPDMSQQQMMPDMSQQQMMTDMSQQQMMPEMSQNMYQGLNNVDINKYLGSIPSYQVNKL
jgi:hypothetical protein